jgi:site-specific recombinase XerD
MDNTYRWHDLFHRPHLICRLQEGPFGPYLEEFAVSLQQQHYSRCTIQRALCAADHFGRWLQQQNLRLEDAHEANRWRYCHLLGRCDAGDWPHRAKGLSLAVRFLQKKGIAEQPAELARDGSPREEWLHRFEQYLERVVGAAPSTRQRYRPILLRFLSLHGGGAEPDWSRLSADDLTTFIQHEASQTKGFGRKVPGVALRSFVRFLVRQGLVREGLGAAIPSPRQFLHATLPARATAEQVTEVLACCENGTPIGLRDHAVLLLLVRLGLRAREVVRLTLNDFDWQQGIIRIRAGKTRCERLLPLPEEVGAALVTYLRRARPPSPERALFLQAQPPHRPWSGASAVSQLVHRRLLQSGFPATPWRGAHLFRHTVASQRVNAGVSLKEVADLLGHQSLTTTSLYAKLDLETLACVALPWQGGKA